MKKIDCKYVWSSLEFDSWIKSQQKKAREQGIEVSTAGITKILCDTVLVPNNLNLIPKIKPKKIRKNGLRAL